MRDRVNHSQQCWHHRGVTRWGAGVDFIWRHPLEVKSEHFQILFHWNNYCFLADLVNFFLNGHTYRRGLTDWLYHPT